MCNVVTDSGSFNGGHGGGKEGSSPVYIHRGTYTEIVPTGGTQEGPGIATTEWNGNKQDSTTISYTGTFGQGAYSSSCDVWSGGGGGWYGGATGYGRAGAGGSGFLSNHLMSYHKIKKHMSCVNCTESSLSDDYTTSALSSDANPVRDCAKLGNGYAKVVLLHIFNSCKKARNNFAHSSIIGVIFISS